MSFILFNIEYRDIMVKYADMSNSTVCRRISQGHSNLTGTNSITLLKDLDQPFIFEVSFGKRQYRLEFYDTSSPENWRLLRPDLVLICFDISNRPSLTNLQRVVRNQITNSSTDPFCTRKLRTNIVVVDQGGPRDISDREYTTTRRLGPEARPEDRG